MYLNVFFIHFIDYLKIYYIFVVLKVVKQLHTTVVNLLIKKSKKMKTVQNLFVLFVLLIANLVQGQQYEFENKSAFPTYEKEVLETIRYFYYPNLQAYFDTKDNLYIYKVDGQWIRKETIPADYRGYSIYNNCKEIVVGLLDDLNPEQTIEEHKKQFPPIYTAKQMKFKLDKEKASRITYSAE